MITEEEVVRDKYGYWSHSVILELEDETPFKKIPELKDMEFAFICFEYDAPEGLQENYFRNNSADVSSWNPTKPKGDNWILISIYDTEDGPFACFVRPKSDL